MNLGEKHIPVLFKELTENVEIFKDKQNIVVDCTLGVGGHASEIVKKLNKSDIFIGFDADNLNLDLAKKSLEKLRDDIIFYFINSNFGNLKDELKKIGIEKISGIYYDLGISSLHLDEAERGFSFMRDGPLDMRLDKSKGIRAKDILNGYKKDDLREIFLKYGESSRANNFSKKIVEFRKKKKFETTKDLSDLIDYGGIKEKSRIFQALRIEVNNELENLEKSLLQAINLLEKDGIIFVISFHSLEDRIVKNIFKKESKDCICSDLICNCLHKKSLKIITKRPIIPSEDEVNKNKRSRSAKARIAKKI